MRCKKRIPSTKFMATISKQNYTAVSDVLLYFVMVQNCHNARLWKYESLCDVLPGSFQYEWWKIPFMMVLTSGRNHDDYRLQNVIIHIDKAKQWWLRSFRAYEMVWRSDFSFVLDRKLLEPIGSYALLEKTFTRSAQFPKFYRRGNHYQHFQAFEFLRLHSNRKADSRLN